MDSQAVDKDRISHSCSCRNAVSGAREHYIVLERVGLCSLSGGAMRRAVNKCSAATKRQTQGGAIFGVAFGQGTVRASRVIDLTLTKEVDSGIGWSPRGSPVYLPFGD